MIQLFRTAVSSPRRTGQLLNQLPSVARGIEFSGKTDFAIGRERGRETDGTANPLLAYFNAHQNGPGIWKWTHYFDIYQRYFQRFVGREVHIMEVGIYSGGSLTMWKDYFGAGCHVYGVDIEPACKAYEGDRTKVFIGDQADRVFWREVKKAVPRVDILIDDGGHLPEQQRVTLEEMLPHLQPGGVYLCEDIHGAHPFPSFVHGLAGTLHLTSPARMPDGQSGAASQASNFQQAIHAIHFYPFVAVIEKREQPIHQFIAPKHGTQWQPFL
jgi:SAM-dependent methyltransferase